MKRVLVTGASGFLGQPSINALLRRGFGVYAISRQPMLQKYPNVIWCKADLHDHVFIKDLVSNIKPSHLLHLSWYLEHGEYWSSEENLKWVISSLNLVEEFMNSGGERLVCAGTCAEYDWTDDACLKNLSEYQTRLKPQTLYGACKVGLQTILSSWTNVRGVSVAWGRVFFPYGPNENPKRLIPLAVLSLLRGQSATCNNLELERDLIFVDDVAEIFAALVDSEISGPINIGSGVPVKLRYVIELIVKSLNVDSLGSYEAGTANETKPPVLIADVSRLRELGMLPRTTLEDGIEKTVAWWREKANRENLHDLHPVKS